MRDSSRIKLEAARPDSLVLSDPARARPVMSGHVRARTQTTPAVHRLCIGHAPRQPADSRAPPKACIEERKRVSIWLLTQLPRRLFRRIIDDAAHMWICGWAFCMHVRWMAGSHQSVQPVQPVQPVRRVELSLASAAMPLSQHSAQYVLGNGIQVELELFVTHARCVSPRSRWTLLTSPSLLLFPPIFSPCRHRSPAVSFPSPFPNAVLLMEMETQTSRPRPSRGCN